ncbi:MAG TPA: flagellar hook-associated protein FlgL [Longimicrobiales bacterium]|nr:flagellar hook-associated protein FlgL [Longimicrobiales bacterium]
MRITNSILQREALSSIQRNLSAMSDAQLRAASGLRVRTSSDDPVAAAEIMRSSSGLRALDQYRRNIGAARGRLSSEEAVLDQLGDLLSRASEIGVAQAGDTSTAMSRNVALGEVNQLIEQAVQLGNTQIDGAYLFGGALADQAPVDANGLVAGWQAAVPTKVEIASGRAIGVTHDGQEVFGDTQLLQSLKALATGLQNNDGAAIRDSLAGLSTSFDKLQDLLGEVGARTNQLDIAGSNIDALEVGFKSTKSDLGEIDLEEAMTTLVSRQTAYQAALVATSRIMSTTLSDYLR